MAVSKVKKYVTLVGVTSLGNILEWYDFAIYTYFAPLFAKLFFPNFALFDALVLTYVINGISFIARPFGGLIFGAYGDRFGRKGALLFTVVCVTIPTFLVGLLPTYQTIGVSAIILLFILRSLQSIPLGGEIPGILTMLVESAPKNHRGFIGSFAWFGAQLGIFLSTLDILFIDQYISEATLEGWYWRVPFFIGGLLGLLGFYMRHKLHETPLFQQAMRQKAIEKKPIVEAFSEHKYQMLQGCGLFLLTEVSFFLLFSFMGIYLHTVRDFSFESGIGLAALMYAISALCMPAIGHLSDRVGKKPILLTSSALIAVLAHPILVLILSGPYSHALIGMSFMSILLAFPYAVTPTLINEIFPTTIRYTAIAFSYNMVTSLFGAFTPVITLMLFKWLKDPAGISSYLVFAAIITFLTTLGVKDMKYLKHM